ncbi:hypothetical protein ACK3SF_01805 [Candidatus Nanosalina sp. VS9-1]|uniref:hypothetical protein n=1 Tax=Candidatus Nanosalina sp. VS9-1 TaxID=3388566 RepID=UPI0039E1A302
MGRANNWRKESEDGESIVWLHEGGYDFRLRADKDEDKKWALSLSSDILPEKYDKEVLTMDTKKKARSIAFDWRKSHTESSDLLKEVGLSMSSSRNVFNPFNMSLAMMNIFLFLALLQTWKFIDPIFGEIFIGIVMGAGGLIFLVEAFYKDGLFNLTAPLHNADEAVSLLTGTFAVLASYGYITQSEFYLTHFSGVQGGILAYMVAYLMLHWLKTRFIGYTRVTARATKKKAFNWKNDLMK